MTYEELVKKIYEDKDFRQRATRENFFLFFNIYFPHYVKYATAEFQREMFTLLQDESHQALVFVAFRGSGKSTIVTMAYVLWSILGKQQKKYVVIGAQTQRQAKQLVQNIKQELEGNRVLRGDLGPFREVPDEWGSMALVVSNYDAKIAGASTEQSIRGTRHGAYRPDLIVCDDVEDLTSTKTIESRDKTYKWFTSEVIPTGDLNTRIIVVGNLLHQDSLIMRLKKKIELDEFTGTFRQYAIRDAEGRRTWPGKYPNEAALAAEEKRLGNYNAWMREYMLMILPETDQLFLPEWFVRYDALPSKDTPEFRYVIVSVDLAISERETADYTAIVMAKVYGYGEKMRIYILPYPMNVRMNFPKTFETMKDISNKHDKKAKVIIEANGFQRGLVEMLTKDGYPAEAIQTGGSDKRARLSLVSPAVKNGIVLFPKTGCDLLIQQLVSFGVESHDDLADAFSMLVSHVTSDNSRSPRETMDSFFRMNESLLRGDMPSKFNRIF